MIGGQHRQFVPDAELRQQRVNRTQLNTGAATHIPQVRSVNMVTAVGHDQRQCGKSLYEILVCTRAGETLQQFLQYQSGGDNRFAAAQGRFQRRDLRSERFCIAPERQRPNTGVYEQRHRERSAL